MHRSTPPHKQLDPAKQAGQIVNPIPKTDQEVYRFMHPTPKPGTVGEYARRKMDALPAFDGVEDAQMALRADDHDDHAGMPVSEGEALCSRIMR